MITHTQPDPQAVAGDLATAFEAHYGAAPAGVWAGPGRVNVIGEHVDYNDGLCLPFALPHCTFAAVAPRTDGQVRARSLQLPDEPWQGTVADLAPGLVTGWAGYVAGVVWAFAQAHPGTAGGADILLSGYVPLGSGLSSSAALECSVAAALDDVHGLGLQGSPAGQIELVALTRRAENEFMATPTGGLDQSASVRCEAASALLLDCRDSSTRQIPFDLAAHGLELLVVDTRASHSHADGEYAHRRADCDRVLGLLPVASLRDVPLAGLDQAVADLVAALGPAADPAEVDRLTRRLRHVVTEIDRVERFVALLEADRVAEGGPLLDASHASLRHDYEVTGTELDLVVDTARAAGALGARMTGGGFGGSAIALVRADDAEKVGTAVAEAFAAAGLRAPAFLTAQPSAGARRVL